MPQMEIQPEKEREGEGERERESTRGKPVFPGTGLFLYFPGPLLYFELYIEINVRNRVTQGQLLRPLSKDSVLSSSLF